MLAVEQTDVLTEIVNVGVGRAAASLSQLVGERIELHAPHVEVCQLEELPDRVPGRDGRPEALVIQGFSGVVSGRSLLGFSRSSGIKLAQLLSGDDESSDHLDLDLCGILEEVGNNVLNGVLGSLSNAMKTSLTYATPDLRTDAAIEDVLRDQMMSNDREEFILITDAHFGVARQELHGSLVIAFDMNGIEIVLKKMMGGGGDA